MSIPVTHLANHFLIATPSLRDSNFSGALIYVCEHNEEGTLGIVVNQLAGMDLYDVLSQTTSHTIDTDLHERPVYVGGPVSPERGFVLHHCDQDWGATTTISENICLSTSRNILEAIAQGQGPNDYLIALGYSGWAAGQLEQELESNAWLTTPASDSILFHELPELRLPAAVQKLGIDLDRLAPSAGHA